MECNVIKDLLPLYIDEVCSEESKELVRNHIEHCPDCRMLYENLKTPTDEIQVVSAPKKMKRINDWKASILQSTLLFVAFACITIGVAKEAATPFGIGDGIWAFSLVIPATGFLLSLPNWYFIRLYKDRKSFSKGCLWLNIGITILGFIWGNYHYEIHLMEAFIDLKFRILVLGVAYYGMGIVITIVFCVLSKVLSNQYALMLGKD